MQGVQPSSGVTIRHLLGPDGGSAGEGTNSPPQGTPAIHLRGYNLGTTLTLLSTAPATVPTLPPGKPGKPSKQQPVNL